MFSLHPVILFEKKERPICWKVYCKKLQKLWWAVRGAKLKTDYATILIDKDKQQAALFEAIEKNSPYPNSFLHESIF